MVATTAPGTPPQNIPDECRCRKERTRSELPDGNRVQQLLSRQPGMLLNQSLLQKGQQHVSTSVKHCTHLEKEKIQSGEWMGGVRESRWRWIPTRRRQRPREAVLSKREDEEGLSANA